jgi:hypothetical protein
MRAGAPEVSGTGVTRTRGSRRSERLVSVGWESVLRPLGKGNGYGRWQNRCQPAAPHAQSPRIRPSHDCANQRTSAVGPGKSDLTPEYTLQSTNTVPRASQTAPPGLTGASASRERVLHLRPTSRRTRLLVPRGSRSGVR